MQENAQQIYVVDDDPAVRDSIMFLLDTVGLQSQAFADASKFLDSYGGGAGVLILDVRMPGMSGLDLQDELARRNWNQLAIIFISGHGDIPMAVEALKKGATDFIPKPFRDQELLDRVQAALALSEEQADSLAQAESIQTNVQSLTPREDEIMRLVAQGKANKVIASDLNISQRTVEIHRAHVMEKMQVRSLAELVKNLHLINYLD